MNEQEISNAFHAMRETTWSAPEGIVDEALQALPGRRWPPIHPSTKRRMKLVAVAGGLAGAAYAARRLSKLKS